MPINIEDIGTTYIRMYPRRPTDSFKLIAVEVVLENATIFIKLMPNNDNVWPILVENDSSHNVSFAQIVREFIKVAHRV